MMAIADQSPPEHSVFINCPFDDDYLPLFDAIVFATLTSGYVPRCALESGSVSIARMDRIFDALNGSNYSIHDLSRCRGEGSANLARFNMPLEFGIAFDRSYVRTNGRRPHDWLVLLPQDHFYKAVISDLNGYDVPTHTGTVKSVIVRVVAWLAMRQPHKQPPVESPGRVLEHFPKFAEAMRALRDEWDGQPPWIRVLETARGVAHEAGLNHA
jgi:hypothetical protein